MSEFTPDTESVREQYTREQPPHIGTVSEKCAEFDRWIRAHDAEVAAAALRRAADDIAARVNGVEPIRAVDRWGGYYGGLRTAMQTEEQVLRLRADRIEAGEFDA